MFTGIIETKAEILERTGEGLVLARPVNSDDLKIGDSICVSGACLSVVGMDHEMMSFDVVDETWQRTKLGNLHKGDSVNIERSMSANGRFEGHIVQGHVEGIAEVLHNGSMTGGQDWMLVIRIPADLLPAVIYKGSITIDGVSLTVAALEDDVCSIAIIPHTLEITTLGTLKAGDTVNLETDMFLRGLHHMLMLRMAGK
jgi:riboflavin synthase